MEHMDKRTFSRMVRRTNVDDLLDDGIDNGSDLKSFARTADDKVDDTPKAQQVDIPTQPPRPNTLLQSKATAVVAPRRAPVSYLGVCIGAFFMTCGAVLFLYPSDTQILHDRLRGKPFVEHVTTTGSQVYAAIAVVLGIAICAFSLYRPKE